MKYRNVSIFILIFLGLCTHGCTASTRHEIGAATPTASPSLGDVWVRASDGMRMVYVPAGKFEMGSDYESTAFARQLCKDYSGKDAIAVCKVAAFGNEKPVHTVTLSGFWIDQAEVTNGQYQKCEQAGACTPPADSSSYTRPTYYGNPDYADFPVIWVTRDQANDYCTRAGGHLPTEAEWEYAARGPESWLFPWGDSFDGTRLNYCDANCDAGPNDPSIDDGYADTAPVGSFPTGASWNGALDMAGNVREWVADWYAPYTPDPQVNPTGPATGVSRIPRGGSWLDKPDDTRSANRGENTPDYTRHKVGFRCAKEDAAGLP